MRLNRCYQQLIIKRKSDAAAIDGLRFEEYTWIEQRDQRCGGETESMSRTTKERADELTRRLVSKTCIILS